MALRKKDGFYYGDGSGDIWKVLAEYSRDAGTEAMHFADAVCVCGATVFHVLLDDDAGVAVRICDVCGVRHPIGNSDAYLDDATLDECECPCKFESFQVAVGVALYENSEDVRWLYLGLRCVRCGLTACYGDWKNEYPGFQDLLRQI